MKVQEVILRAMAKKLTWFQAAEIIGISDRQMRRWRERYEEHGYDGLMDRRRGVPSGKRVPLAGGTMEFMLTFAYDVTDEMVVGAPKWVTTDHFDINAKASSDSPSAQPGAP
jgi:uncharacterized protein (TIGR03435 family)